MINIKVSISERELNALRQLAQSELRDARLQASILIRQGLIRCGLIRKGKNMEEKKTYSTDGGRAGDGVWAILELFGHKVVAGYISKDESLGTPLIRLDVPATERYPAFTRHYSPYAIYSVSYVSEETARLTAEQVAAVPRFRTKTAETARLTAEQLQDNPVTVYVPEIKESDTLRQIIHTWEQRYQALSEQLKKQKMLPEQTFEPYPDEEPDREPEPEGVSSPEDYDPEIDPEYLGDDDDLIDEGDPSPDIEDYLRDEEP